MRLIDADKLECVSATMPHEASEDYKEGYGDGMNYVLEIIDDLPTIDPVKWIPVSERLPLSREEVIVSVCDKTGDTRYNSTSHGWLTTDKEYWIVDDEINNYVVAWMPLPEPWKEVTE